ncbi:CpaF family protein [Blastopirellula marina]|uniref:Probable secretion atpase protein n=1 Tax=Blastopirellula marina DSM 3645 TaxID=314230 RepID=A3ZT92_9BACT|nr:CpaF family protein [Blastopirellula marina]EAQ80145.1 probable secretion atpase protein [Blastopirellula marina DSM 3645]
MIMPNHAAPNRNIDQAEIEFQRLKTSLHEEMVDSLDLGAVTNRNEEAIRGDIRNLSSKYCQRKNLKLDAETRERLEKELDYELFGLGPIEPLMHDPTISDILVNGAREVYIERFGQLELTDVIFADDAHVLRIIQRVVGRVGRRIDEVSPMVDARLPDGSRVNAVVAPLALGGPKLSIRRFGVEHLHLANLIATDSLSQEMADFLQAAVASRISFLISGGTGAGKTTLLNALSTYIPHDERIVTIEDSAELLLQHPHVLGMETRPSNAEGAGAVTQRDLVRNSLRMRPDRIIVGEVRGAEALDMLQAMNTGHEGSLTTIHANDSRDALARLEMMVAMTGFELPVKVIRQYIATGIKMVVHVSRLKGGVRRVTRIAEIREVNENGDYVLDDIFGFRQEGLDEQGRAKGRFYATGYWALCRERFANAGVEFDDAVMKKHESDLIYAKYLNSRGEVAQSSDESGLLDLAADADMHDAGGDPEEGA